MCNVIGAETDRKDDSERRVKLLGILRELWEGGFFPKTKKIFRRYEHAGIKKVISSLDLLALQSLRIYSLSAFPILPRAFRNGRCFC